MKNNDLQIIASHLLEKRVPNEPFLVAIDGMPCSGKTTFSRSLAIVLEKAGYHTCNISLDDFCNPREFRYRSDEPKSLQVYKYNFMEDFFAEKVLRPTKDNKSLEFNFMGLDPITDRHTRQVSFSVYNHSIVIIEGLHIFKPIFNLYFNYRIMISIISETQLERAKIRDVVDRLNPPEGIEEKYLNRFQPSFDYYLKKDKPMDNIDLHIINDDPDCPILDFR